MRAYQIVRDAPPGYRPGRPRKWARAVERERREALRGHHDIAEMAERVVALTAERDRLWQQVVRLQQCIAQLENALAGRPMDATPSTRPGRDRRVVTCRTSTARTRATAPTLTRTVRDCAARAATLGRVVLFTLTNVDPVVMDREHQRGMSRITTRITTLPANQNPVLHRGSR